MSYYYYRQQPQWGTSSYQMAAPPRPVYQPQPNWTGRNYYRAQAGLNLDAYDRDDGFFDNVWRGIKDVFSKGLSKQEARAWHRRIYGGMVGIDAVEMEAIGAAAGYEAIRNWSAHKSTYRAPLMDDSEREKEALAGLAIGEAERLLTYGTFLNRMSRSKYDRFRREVAEIAAATAERIFAEEYEDDYEQFETPSRKLHRRGSSAGLEIAEAQRHRRRSSASYTTRPLVQTLTGGAYSASPQPTYVAASPQPTYLQSSSTGYAQQAAYRQSPGTSYLTTGQPGVQYVSSGGVTYATTGQPQPQYVQASHTGGYLQAGVQPGVQYVQQPGVQYAQQPGVQYVSSTGQPVQYVQPSHTGGVVYQQPTGGQYLTATTTGRPRHHSMSHGSGYVYR